jgi:hypothetical protein
MEIREQIEGACDQKRALKGACAGQRLGRIGDRVDLREVGFGAQGQLFRG